MRNRRTNIYAANQKSGKVYRGWVAGTAVKFINPQLEFQNASVTAIPGGNPSGTMKVQPAGTRISRVIAPLGGTRLQYAIDSSTDKCCDKGAGTFTEEIYKDNWSKNGVVGCCATKPTRALQPLIKSGLQYNENVSKYAFSYREYRQNKRNITYQRKLSKFDKISDNTFKSGNGDGCTGCAEMTYKPSNKKFAKQGAVSAGSRLERLKLDTLTASRLTKTQLIDCGSDCEKLKVGPTTYNGGKVRFVTNGSKTAGFVPTRWRQSYIAHGRAIGNIFQRTTSNDTAGKTRSVLPYQIGSIRGCEGVDCP
jgi:hypothetical protein